MMQSAPSGSPRQEHNDPDGSRFRYAFRPKQPAALTLRPGAPISRDLIHKAYIRPPMANTKSAKKAARQIARRTVINKSRRARVRSATRKVEEALTAGDRSRALAAMAEAEPALIRAAQKGIVHRNAARRKVSRLAQRIAKLEKK
jgi:small subunit ribosomal protein S20